MLNVCLEHFAYHVQMITGGQIIGGTMYFYYPWIDPNFTIKVEIFDCNPENEKIAKVRLNDQEFESRSKACDAYYLMVENIFKKAILKDLANEWIGMIRDYELSEIVKFLNICLKIYLGICFLAIGSWYVIG